MMRTQPKTRVQGMSAYSVPLVFDGVKLNQNESAQDLPVGIKQEILKRLMERGWNRYPVDPCDGLARKISEYTNFPVEGIMVGSGSNELIQTVIYGWCDSGDAILTVEPTFSVYQRVCEVMNIRNIGIRLNADFSFDVPSILERAGDARLIILACPNNPTGTVLELACIAEIAERSDALVVVDEAYYEFYRETAQRLIREYPNIVVLRTFSKAMRGAGLRLGYLMADPKVTKELKKIKLPFSVGMFQQVAGEVIMENYSQLKELIKRTVIERKRVFEQLQSLNGIVPVESQANFILFRPVIVPAKELYRKLCNKGVLVRAYDSPQLSGMLRVSIGTVTENNKFLSSLIKSFAEVQGAPVGDGLYDTPHCGPLAAGGIK